MREKLLDIIKHTGGLGFVEVVRVTGTDESTVFEATDNDRTIIIRAELKEVEPSLKGEFGMRNLNILQGLLNHAPYKADGAKLDVKRELKDGAETPVELTFKTEDGKNPAFFRFMAANLVPPQPQLKHKSWDIDVTPTDSKILEFSNIASLYSSIENYFSVVTKDGDLEFHIGDEKGSNHSASLVFASGVEGEIKTTLYWPFQQVLNVLKIGKGEKPKLQIMNLGALQITLESEYANYSMILPARKK